MEHGDKEGVNVTEDMRRMFLLAADQYERNAKLDLNGAYHLCMRMFFSEVTEELRAAHGKRVPKEEFAKAGLPRYEQFVYHVRRDRERTASDRKRLGDRVYEMTRRALLSDSTREAWGPGARFQIDATVLDVYVRSRRNRRRLIGRPTLYVVIDVFSRMIVGFSLSFDPPSWQSAMTALANAVCDKVAFCAKFGITIEWSMWPCNHLCAILEGDRGEIEAAKIDGLAQYVMIENAAAFRADWKGVVESRFRILQRAFGPYVEGYVDCDFRERGARDYRLDAVLDVDDMTRIIIRLIFYYNNCHELTKYPKIPEMTGDGVPAVPRELWNWGIANVGGQPRAPKADEVLFKLLPRKEVSVTREGIYFHGNHYTCETAIREGWFEKAGRKRFKVTISYDKRDADIVYVHVPGSPGFEVGTLTASSRRRAGSNGWEVEDLIKQDAHISANRRDEQVMARAQVEAENEAEVAEAKGKFEELPPQGSLASQVQGLRGARAEELAQDRVVDAAEYRAVITGKPAPDAESDTAGERPEAEVIPFDRGREGAPSFAAPSMRYIIRKMKEVNDA